MQQSQQLLDQFSCIEDMQLNQRNGESLWVVEGELYFGTSETVP